jgi:ATP-dependent exoDNAse (exonuclease V) beta subunit
LLYVACTRAKDHLVLVMPDAPKPGSWADMLEPFVGDKPKYTYGQLRRSGSRAEPRTVMPSGTINELNLLPPLPDDALPREIGVTALLESQQPVLRQRRNRNQEERRECGQIVHRLLELGVDVTQVHVANLAFAQNLPEAVVPVLLKQVQAAQRWLSEQGYDLSCARREVPFTVPAAALRPLIPAASTEWVNGTIDLMVPLMSGWAIVDFKTGRDDSLEIHQRQLQLYAAAARYSGMDVNACWLLFLHADGTIAPVAVEMSNRS